jgi:hypothetical protein
MFGLQAAGTGAPGPSQTFGGRAQCSAGAASPLRCGCQLSSLLLEACGWVCPHYTCDTIRSNTLHPGSANQTVGICAAALPERRIPLPLPCVPTATYSSVVLRRHVAIDHQRAPQHRDPAPPSPSSSADPRPPNPGRTAASHNILRARPTDPMASSFEKSVKGGTKIKVPPGCHC